MFTYPTNQPRDDDMTIEPLAELLNDHISVTVDMGDFECVYSRKYRGPDAGLWADEGGDIIGDDTDLATFVINSGSRVYAP